jgi:hypothetical protein
MENTMSQWVNRVSEDFLLDAEAGKLQCAGCGGKSCTTTGLPESLMTGAVRRVALCNRCREELRLLEGMNRYRFVRQMRDTAQARHQREKRERRLPLVATQEGLLRPL